MAAAAPAKKGTGRRPQAAGARSARNAQALQRARTTHKTKRAAAAPARRKSGPAPRPKTAPRPAPRPATSDLRPATRAVARVAQSGGSVLLDRLLRGRAWVFLIGALLAGIVFLNVSVLELNRGIAQTDAAAAKLERKNSLLRERVAKLDSTERIQSLAEARGFVLPAPGEVEYLDPNRAKDARLAAQRIDETPDEVAATAPVVPETPAPAPEPVAATTPPAPPTATLPTAYSPEPTAPVAPTP